MRAVSLEKLLPSDVPPGERILWHGRPRWLGLARRAYRGDFIAAYFVALSAWSFWQAFSEGWSAAALATMKTMGLGMGVLAIVALLSYLSARTTLYVVTSRRLVFKVGIALPVFINIPLKEIRSAALRVHGDQTGDIPVTLNKGRRVGYFLLWPSARPLHLLRPQPCLRSVANPSAVAQTLAAALQEGEGRQAAAAPASKSVEDRVEPLALAHRAAA